MLGEGRGSETSGLKGGTSGSGGGRGFSLWFGVTSGCEGRDFRSGVERVIRASEGGRDFRFTGHIHFREEGRFRFARGRDFRFWGGLKGAGCGIGGAQGAPLTHRSDPSPIDPIPAP